MTENLSQILPLVWKFREKILADARLSRVQLPNTLSQYVTFRVGGLIQCWQNAPDLFRVGSEDTPQLVYNILGSPLSGACTVEYIDLATNTLKSATNQLTFKSLFSKQQFPVKPFLTYVKAYQMQEKKSEAEPASFSELEKTLKIWDNL